MAIPVCLQTGKASLGFARQQLVGQQSPGANLCCPSNPSCMEMGGPYSVRGMADTPSSPLPGVSRLSGLCCENPRVCARRAPGTPWACSFRNCPPSAGALCPSTHPGAGGSLQCTPGPAGPGSAPPRSVGPSLSASSSGPCTPSQLEGEWGPHGASEAPEAAGKRPRGADAVPCSCPLGVGLSWIRALLRRLR